MMFHAPILVLAVVGTLHGWSSNQSVWFGAWFIVAIYTLVNMNELRLQRNAS